jgi:hypothetical protein
VTQDEIDAHYTKVNAMTDLSMSMFASKDDLIKAQAARIAELEAALRYVACKCKKDCDFWGVGSDEKPCAGFVAQLALNNSN